LELIQLTGKKMSDLMKNQAAERSFKTVFFVLDVPRPLLYERINNRVDALFENGLLEEAKSLYPFKDFPALRTVGYQELFGFFEKEYGLDRAIELIKRNSRRYAKRQITWFKRYQNAHWISPSVFEDPAAILEIVSKTPEASKVNQTLK
jgi:tRNA dimethylallyltransferase